MKSAGLMSMPCVREAGRRSCTCGPSLWQNTELRIYKRIAQRAGGKKQIAADECGAELEDRQMAIMHFERLHEIFRTVISRIWSATVTNCIRFTGRH